MKILVPSKPEHFENYKNALLASSLIPVNSMYAENISQFAGLLLPGGGDMDPALWGEAPAKGMSSVYDTTTDNLQIALAKQFIHHKKPILGICKGMQLINILFGGTLHQDLSTAATHCYDSCDRLHSSRALKDSFLYNLFGENFTINSAHHQGVNKIGTDLKIIQVCPLDSVVEGFVHNSLPIIGLQWHPERLCHSYATPYAIDGSKIFDYFRFIVRSNALSSSETL